MASAATTATGRQTRRPQRRRRTTNHHYRIIPLTQRRPYARLDVLPFAILYTLLIAYEHLHHDGSSAGGEEDREDEEEEEQWYYHLSDALLPLAMLIHVALRLACVWNVGVRARVGYRRAASATASSASSASSLAKADHWTHVLVVPPPNGGGGGPGIVPIVSRQDGVITVDFRQICFRCCLGQGGGGGDDEMDSIWSTGTTAGSTSVAGGGASSDNSNSSTTNMFHTLHFPIDLPLQFYTKWIGHSTSQSLSRTTTIFGNNTHPIPIPPITALLSHQLLQPFFLFQLLCVMLWSLDEYWYYAIFTLIMLVIFEWTMSFNRLKSLQRLRETLRPPIQVWTYRSKKWMIIMSNELVAGDVVSLTSSEGSGGGGGGGASASFGGRRHGGAAHDHEGGTHVPCDMVLLKGGAVVNEAVLTGESVPQIKEGVEALAVQAGANAAATSDDSDDDAGRLDIEDPAHKRSVLFGGTLLVNHIPFSSDDAAKSAAGIDSIPPPPDGGLVALVLRTGFDTVQGSLLRTMVHSTVSSSGQSDGINTTDTYIFVALLLLCAVASSVLVLQEGWSDPTRNRFKLILHVVIIITSVVPPELPMELSLAVTTSIADLVSRCKVYCTEPWRIPMAGKVDVCCFDKTGTLTSDEMVLRGVRLCDDDGSSMIGCADGTTVGTNEDLVLPTKFPRGDSDSMSDDANESLSSQTEIPTETLRVMVACHGLATRPSPKTRGMTQEVIGDPLEKAVLNGCGWQLVRGDVVTPPLPSYGMLSTGQEQANAYSRPSPIRIVHRYAFTSKLRRMSVLATEVVNGAGKPPSNDVWVLTKGAPETIRTLLKPDSIPTNYDQVARYHMGLGQRVLVLAYRKTGVPPSLISQLKEKERSQIEHDLIFAGFLVLDCPLKPDSRRVIKELRTTGHQVKMITGDAALTATEVAKQVGIIGSSKKMKKTESAIVVYEMTEVDHSMGENLGEDVPLSSPEFAFVPLDEDQSGTKGTIAYVPSNLQIVLDMVKKNEIAVSVTGEILTKIAIDAVDAVRSEHVRSKPGHDAYIDPKTVLLHPAAQTVLQKLVPIVSVFARHAPRQKEAVIAALNGNGSVTLMCGDGTNDVGALKMAHVGISIVSVPDLEAKQREALKGMSSAKQDKKAGKKKSKMKASSAKKKTLEESLKALAEAEEELNFVALGDASVASPFTSRTMSIKCTKDILQRGRCTLVTMLQIYRILGVNCLVNALVLTRLHMVGVKQGDRQLTVVGLVVAALFYFVTRGQPLSSLSPTRPPSSVLCSQTLFSIAMQFAVHFACIMAVTHLSTLHLDPDDPSLVPDGPFNPNILNTATFLVTVLATVNTFVVNYRGRPYMQNLVENKLMLRSVQICYGALFACAFEAFPPLNELMQLTPLPADGAEVFAASEGMQKLLSSVAESLGFKLTLSLLMIFDVLLAIGSEKLVQRLFER